MTELLTKSWLAGKLAEAVGAAGKSYRPQGTCEMSCLDPKELWTVETGHATPFCQPFLVSWWLQPDYLTSKLQAGGKSPFRSEGQARRGSINVPLPFLSSLCPPLGSSTADVMEGGGKPVFWLDCFSLPASMEFLLFSTSVNRGEHMGLGDSMFHGLLGCQNVLHYYLLQHSRWSSLRKKKTSAAGP